MEPPTSTTSGSGSLTEWWRTAVVYQVYPRSFADADGDGVGDLRGIARHLDHLEMLGVDVIWLSPVYQSPHDDNGYDISDYRAIDPVFGTLEDFDDLVADMHRRGMKLMMDLVVNHTSDEHPWFLESRSSRNNSKRDWYWWRPARPGLIAGEPGAEPTNWEAAFAGPAWHLDDTTGEYYLHLFSRKQPDLNWENPDVRAAIYETMRWWLDRGVDGFRMDVINFISKHIRPDGSLPEGVVTEDAAFGDGRAAYVSGPRIHEFLQEMHRDVFQGRPDRYLTVGEMPGVTLEDASLFTDPSRQEVDMVFQFEHLQTDLGATKWDIRPLRLVDLKASLGRWQTGLAAEGWNSLYWDNHDQPRIVSRFGDDGEYRELSATMLATVLHMHRGTPYVYQGEELGMTNSHFERIDQYRDIESLNFYADARAAGEITPDAALGALHAVSRDNARTPVQWDTTPNAGFTTGDPWIEVNPNFVAINAAAQHADAGSIFHYYRRLISLRHTEPAVAFGDFTMLIPEDDAVYAFLRRWEAIEILVLGNFTADELTIDIPAAQPWANAELLIGNYPTISVPGRLRPWEARVYRRRISPSSE